MRKNRAFLYLQIMASLLLILIAPFLQSVCQGASENLWYVHDVIDVSLDEVKWMEEGGISEAASWISDGSWYQASMRQSLVDANDIFVSTYEQFNWSLVNQIADYYYGVQFNSFDDFANFVKNDPRQWLDLAWQIDTEWYGVSMNTTKVKVDFEGNSSTAEMWTYFHVTRIPEYFVGEGNLESWLTGFDLTPVSTGSLKIWEFYKDWNQHGISYSLRFKAPAVLLTQHGENFTCRIGVSPSFQGNRFRIQQVIDINMPPNTEIKETAPVSMSILRGNTATFVLAANDTYPASFTIVSGPPAKSLGQAVLEGASLWLSTPAGWAAIASLSVLSFTGLRGRRIWNRNKLYHRLYKSMVTVYDIHSNDLLKFHQEMDSMSKSIIKLFIEDRITDEQFEKLLQRRDDLLERMRVTTSS